MSEGRTVYDIGVAVDTVFGINRLLLRHVLLPEPSVVRDTVLYAAIGERCFGGHFWSSKVSYIPFFTD